MTPCLRLEVGLVTLAALVVICTQGLKIDFSRLALNRPALFAQKRHFGSECEVNPCPLSKPFLCRSQPKTCIGLRFVCDGTPDCQDGFDEEKSLCNAAERPPFDDLLFVIENEIRWMGPKFFNGADPELIAHALTVASDMQDLSESIGMTPENEELLRKAFEASLEGDERPLEKMGMPDSSWHEVHYLLTKLMESGFQF